MAKVEKHPDNENIVNVGSNYRIEPGPPRITVVATEELLHNDETAGHYFAPYIETVDDGKGGTREREVMSRDADGKPIKLGEEITILDWGGDKRQGERVFYIYEKQEVNSVDEFVNGEENPHYVPDHVREAAANGERGDDRVFYDYKWVEVATRKSLDAAVDFAQKNAVD